MSLYKYIQSNLSYPNVDYPKLLGYSKTMDSPDFFPIIHCNKTTYYSNFDYPKKSIFRSDSSVPLKKMLLNYPSRFEVQMSRMVIMISLFGRVRLTRLSDLEKKVETGN